MISLGLIIYIARFFWDPKMQICMVVLRDFPLIMSEYFEGYELRNEHSQGSSWIIEQSY